MTLSRSVLVAIALSAPILANGSCKCVSSNPSVILLASTLINNQIPSDACWPSLSAWSALNSTLSSSLIATTPPAQVCYPGPTQNAESCATIATLLTNSTFIDDNPIALDYPLINSCPAVLSNGTDGQTCTLISNPVYAINATSVQDVIEGVNFARERNVRLVIRNTGHDLLGRSTGGGSLEIWIRYLRTGLEWMDNFVGTNGCTDGYEGGAVRIGGGYVWADVNAEAEERGRIVVSGGDPVGLLSRFDY